MNSHERYPKKRHHIFMHFAKNDIDPKWQNLNVKSYIAVCDKMHTRSSCLYFQESFSKSILYWLKCNTYAAIQKHVDELNVTNKFTFFYIDFYQRGTMGGGG